MVELSNPVLLGWLLAWALALVVAALAWARGRGTPPRDGDRDDARPVQKPAATEAEVAPRERFRLGLARSREGLTRRIRDAFGRDEAFEDHLESLEQALIESDVGVRTSQTLLDAVRNLPAQERTERGVVTALRSEVGSLLAQEPGDLEPEIPGPWVCLVVGVNGVGKTTTIGKLAKRYRDAGHSVLLVAGDTFRAAAIDQLAVWGERVGADVLRQEPGADPSAVVFDGVSSAVARKTDVVLVDTAGRLHTKVNLMEELKKVRRVVEKVCPGAPHEVLLVVDATTGQNAISQARTFSETVGVSGVALSKLDGSARGGMAVAIRSELGLPVRLVGLGESAADLQPFDAEAFLDGLLPMPE